MALETAFCSRRRSSSSCMSFTHNVTIDCQFELESHDLDCWYSLGIFMIVIIRDFHHLQCAIAFRILQNLVKQSKILFPTSRLSVHPCVGLSED